MRNLGNVYICLGIYIALVLISGSQLLYNLFQIIRKYVNKHKNISDYIPTYFLFLSIM